MHRKFNVTVLQDFGNYQTLRKVIFVSYDPPGQGDICLANNDIVKEKVIHWEEMNNTEVIIKEKRGSNDGSNQDSG